MEALLDNVREFCGSYIRTSCVRPSMEPKPPHEAAASTDAVRPTPSHGLHLNRKIAASDSQAESELSEFTVRT